MAKPLDLKMGACSPRILGPCLKAQRPKEAGLGVQVGRVGQQSCDQSRRGCWEPSQEDPGLRTELQRNQGQDIEGRQWLGLGVLKQKVFVIIWPDLIERLSPRGDDP